jgi:hypothetical protein
VWLARRFRHLRGDARAYTWYSPNGEERLPGRPGLRQSRAAAAYESRALRLGRRRPATR